nr:protein adenylyltransferase SelO family protein [uncultured Cohaesibacter sp.]
MQLFDDEEAILRWLRDWQDRLQEEARSVEDIAEGMKRVNPLYIPRNHLVEAALAQAEDYADFGPVKQLLAVLEKPFEEQAGREDYASPAPKAFGPFVSYCGT